MKYLAELHTRFSDSGESFEQAVARLGLGYDLNPAIAVWLGYDLVPTRKQSRNRLNKEQRIWQQMSIKVIQRPTFRLHSRSRLEQRFDEYDPGTAYRFRQKFTMKFPNQFSDNVTPLLANEIFFNLNYPVWVTDHRTDQNRITLGFEFRVRNFGKIRLAYQNHYQFREPNNKMDHVLNISFTILVANDI